jgi:hypothetical protein
MKRLLFTLLFLFLLGSGLLIALWQFRNPLLEWGLEQSLNRTQSALFNGTLDFEGVQLDPDLKVKIAVVQGDWQTPNGTFPLVVEAIQLQDPLTHFWQHKPLRATFQLRPQASKHPGLQGHAVFHNDAAATFTLEARFLGVGLEEMAVLDPEHLKGASGVLTGDLYLKASLKGQEVFRLKLNVVPPGGRLQARFFDLLLPYLPAADKGVIETIRSTQTVRYHEADLTAELTGPEVLNLLLHIQVPDYNLNLNLNVKVRVEAHDAFTQLAEVMGLITVQTA